MNQCACSSFCKVNEFEIHKPYFALISCLLLAKSLEVLSDMLNLTPKYRKSIIGMSIGIGLGLFLISSISFMGFLLMPIALASLAALIIGVLWFTIEHKNIGLSRTASILTVVLMPIATIPLYLIYVISLGFFLQALFDGLALLFLGSGFSAIGLVGVYARKSPKKLGIFFMILSSIFLLGIPLVNEYEVLATRWGTWIATPYEGYTIPLILVGAAFFLLGCGLIFLKKSWDAKGWMLDTKQFELNKTEQDTTHETNVPETVAKKCDIFSGNLGFMCLILGSLGLILAAAVYAPNGPTPLIWGIGQTPSRELTLALIILSAALFILGPILVLYEKSKGLGLYLGVLGSLFLVAAGFAHGFRMDVAELVFGHVQVIHRINPFREFTLVLVMASFPFFVLSYMLMLRRTA